MNQNFKDFKKLEVWIQSYELTIMIYKLTQRFPESEKFGLTNQMRRASVSIISNIAEGCGRQHVKEKIQFFSMARGSLFEVESQMEIAFGLNLLSAQSYRNQFKQMRKCTAILNGFITHYKKK